MLIVEYYFPDGSMFFVDKITGHVPHTGDKIVHPYSQQTYLVDSAPEFWVARQTVKLKVKPLEVV